MWHKLFSCAAIRHLSKIIREDPPCGEQLPLKENQRRATPSPKGYLHVKQLIVGEATVHRGSNQLDLAQYGAQLPKGHQPDKITPR